MIVRHLPSNTAAPTVAPSTGSWWKPSAADVLILALMAWSFFLLSDASSLVNDANTGLHIRTGDWIRSHGWVPSLDLFSYSQPEKPWIAQEWLTTLIYSYLNQWLGLAGVVVLSLVALGATFLIMLRNMTRAGAVAILSVPLVLIAFRVSTIHFLARPHLLTWLLLSIVVAIVQADRMKPGKALWLLVALELVWTSLHGGFLTLPVYLGLVCAGLVAECNWVQAKRYTLVMAAASAVTVVNPYGWHLHAHILETLTSRWISEMVEEFQPPWAHPDERVYMFYVVGAAAAIAAAGMLRRRQFVGPILIAFFLAASMRSIRHIPIFFITSLPFVARYYSSLWNACVAGADRKSALAAFNALSLDLTPGFGRISAVLPVLAAIALAVPGHFGLPQSFPDSKFPTRLIADHAGALRQSRLLTHDGWADYLIFANWPEQRVWADGRNDFFGPKFGQEYFALMDAEPKAAELLERWKFNAILVKRSTKLATWLKTRPEWQEQARDSQAVLFFKRG
jgi:hypothetical protein